MKNPTIAIAYDWATTQTGGAEKVLQALHHTFPDAPLLTSFATTQTRWLRNWKTIFTSLNRLPNWAKRHRWWGPILPSQFELLDTSSYEIVISVSGGPAKAILTKPNQLHITYLLTPPRYLYTHQSLYKKDLPFTGWLSKISQPLWNYWQRIDQVSSTRPDVIVPISKIVADRCQKWYHRNPDTIIYPPFDTVRELPVSQPSTTPTWLCVSRLVRYKQLDTVIQACLQLGHNLLIVGEGPDLARLKKWAKVGTTDQIKFAGHLEQAELELTYAHASGVIMPALEDFGITAIEAAWRGLPVVLHADSGASEILPAEAVVLLTSVDQQNLVQALTKAQKIKPNRDSVQQVLTKYGTTEFCKQWKEAVSHYWQAHQERMS